LNAALLQVQVCDELDERVDHTAENAAAALVDVGQQRSDEAGFDSLLGWPG
jgi:hypothetical protein